MRIVLVLFFVLACVIGIVLFLFEKQQVKFVSPLSKTDEKPLDKYSFERLREAKFASSSIRIEKVLKEDPKFTSYLFFFNDTFNGKEKKVSGLINVPSVGGTFPVVIMLRGYVEREVYLTGEGTRRTAEVFAKNGFITLAPDFLGYGESDMPSEMPIEERLQTYTTTLSLLASLPTLNPALVAKGEKARWREKGNTVGIWAHSNGGQIALSTLAITSKPIPTVLWAPVSKPFPYNILYFTDEYADEGKALRKVVADFERDYDVFHYTPTKYFHWIRAAIQLHQGEDDESVPKKWSDQLDTILNQNKIDHEYLVYPRENHNFNNGSWQLAVERSIEFFKNHLNAQDNLRK
jgi:dienelactone hydrolase